MLFMVIETFDRADMGPVYQRLREKGRMLPDGVRVMDSWVEVSMGRCFQLMESDDAARLQEWVLGWRDTGVRFEIVPVVPSAVTRRLHDPIPRSE